MIIRRALISVYDKTGVVDFARALHETFGIEIISTGGTAKLLVGNGIPVTLVEDIAGFPEMLDGRVKTLHPNIFAGILADRDNPEHMRQLEAMGVKPIDMVVVNLYPFEKTVADPNCTFEQAIEMIDIGGVALLRAAAKNHRHVLAVGHPRLYRMALLLIRDSDTSPADTRLRILSYNAFLATAMYDSAIARWASRLTPETEPMYQAVHLLNEVRFRYGENPHQDGSFHAALSHDFAGLHDPPWTVNLLSVSVDLQDRSDLVAQQTQEPLPSYNNYLDADAAIRLCAELNREMGRPVICWQADPKSQVISGRIGGPVFQPVNHGWPSRRVTETKHTRRHLPHIETPSICVFVKHNNACGAGVADMPIEAYRLAYLGDPNAAMGGILAVNFDVDAGFAATVMETFDRFGKLLKQAGAPNAPGGYFLEVWIAPSFTDQAVNIIRGMAEPTDAVPNPPKKPWGGKVRLLAVGDMTEPLHPEALEYRSIAGGMLVQTPDLVGLNEDQWKVVTKRSPTESEMADLRLAWIIAKHTKSNAISIVRNGQLIGNGAGQMSRVMSCRIAVWLARENGHLSEGTKAGTRDRSQTRERAAGMADDPSVQDEACGSRGPSSPVAASDAFFPFRDGPDILMDAGVTAIIQPGGSKRDAEVIAACDERGAAMIFTGTRHFRH